MDHEIQFDHGGWEGVNRVLEEVGSKFEGGKSGGKLVKGVVVYSAHEIKSSESGREAIEGMVEALHKHN